MEAIITQCHARYYTFVLIFEHEIQVFPELFFFTLFVCHFENRQILTISVGHSVQIFVDFERVLASKHLPCKSN